MSIWGSLIGGFVGFSFAGPIGALIGSMLGGRISSARRSSFQRSFAHSQQIFAIALIILTAKLAKADGYVSKEELIAIKNKFHGQIYPGKLSSHLKKAFGRGGQTNIGSNSIFLFGCHPPSGFINVFSFINFLYFELIYYYMADWLNLKYFICI